MDVQSVRLLYGANRMITRFRNINERYPLQQIQLLLTLGIAEAGMTNHSNGVDNVELQSWAGTHGTAHSAALAGLTGRRAKKGLSAKSRVREDALIEQFYPVWDRRHMRVRLTSAGRQMIRRVIADLKRETVDGEQDERKPVVQDLRE